MDISNEVEEISGHKGTFEGKPFFVGLEDSVAPVDYVDGVDVLLILGHAFEGEIGVVDTSSRGKLHIREMIVVEEVRAV